MTERSFNYGVSIVIGHVKVFHYQGSRTERPVSARWVPLFSLDRLEMDLLQNE